MIIERSKCEENFIERLINDSDKEYELSDYFKSRAYSNLISNKDIVVFVEQHIDKSKRQKAIKSFVYSNHNIDVIKNKPKKIRRNENENNIYKKE